ncbi:NnrS family protein [Isorropodon fossajaponicum symbiont]|uniref:NnrS family protein n=1 Tax=Isorropodon fossajaponicum symbiont TaxID=883811 RepID=UPI001CEC01CC
MWLTGFGFKSLSYFITLPPNLDIHSLIFVLLSLSFVFRVIFPVLNMTYYHEWILIAQALWISAFMGFLLICMPLFFKPRIDGQFG